MRYVSVSMRPFRVHCRRFISSVTMVALTSLCTFALPLSPAIAQEHASLASIKPITVKVTDAPLIDVITRIAKEYNLHLDDGNAKIIEASKQLVTLNATEQPLEVMLKILTGASVSPQTMYRFAVVGKALRVQPIPLAANGLPLSRVTGEFHPGPLDKALDMLLEDFYFVRFVPEDLRLERPVSLKNVPLAEAVPLLLQACSQPLDWSPRGAVFIVSRASTTPSDRGHRGLRYRDVTTVVPDPAFAPR